MKMPVIASLALLASLLPMVAQDPAGTHEGYPVLKASELLRPEILKGPYHTVMEAVPTQGFANQYTVETNWGVFTVRGNDLLAKRIHEFEAIVRLESASKSDEFKNSLRKAAATPLHMIGNTLEDPVGTVKGIGAGAGRFFRKVGESIERGGKKSANTDGTMKSVLGFSKAKREIAAHLEVDPYSDNHVLQQRLDDMAKASFAGGFAVRAGTFALSAGAGVGVATVAGTASLASDVSKMVRDNDPVGLSLINRGILTEQLGISEAGAEAFLEHPHITPSQQTIITQYLARLGKVGGNEDFLTMVCSSKDVPDVEFFVGTAKIMADYHEQVSPVKRVLDLYGLPAIHVMTNALVIPLAVDYGSWSEESDRLSLALQGYHPQVEISERVLYLSGRVSPMARKNFEARGFKVVDGTHIPLYR